MYYQDLIFRGVPASEISPKCFPLSNSSIILSVLMFSLSLLKEMSFLDIFKWFNNLTEILVSSHNI